MRRSRRIPLPLLVVLAAVLVEGLAWAFAVPALQGADESGHFAYVQKIADGHEIPWSTGPAIERENPAAVSVEQLYAGVFAGLEPLRGNVAARPLWTPSDEAIWARLSAGGSRDSGDMNPSFSNPPLYYLSAVVPYEIAGGTFFDRLFALRLYNVALLVIAVALTWLLAGEVFGRRRELQTVAAAAVALQPVLLDVWTRVTPDALLGALAATALYLMALVVNRGPSWRLVALLALTVVAASLTHARGVGLAIPALLAVGVAWWRRRPGERRDCSTGPWRAGGPRIVASAAVAWVVVAVAVMVALAVYATRARFGELAGFWSYLWQFYLPALPGMSPPVGPSWGVHQVYLDRFLSTFVQFEVGFPQDLRNGLRIAVWVGLALVVAAAVRHRRALAARRDVVVVLLLALVVTVLSLHAAAFRSLLVNPADPVFTGRYLLMLIPLFGLGVAAAMSALPGRVRAGATGALLAGGVLVQLSAFGLVVARFYA